MLVRSVLPPFVGLRCQYPPGGFVFFVVLASKQGVVRSFHQWRAELLWGNKKRHLGFFERRELLHAGVLYRTAAPKPPIKDKRPAMHDLHVLQHTECFSQYRGFAPKGLGLGCDT